MRKDKKISYFLDVLLALVASLCLTAICLLAMWLRLDGATLPLVFAAIIFTVIGWGFGRRTCIKDIFPLKFEGKICRNKKIA
jgi:hypothetical protein